jgi:hypothetical protein
MKRREFLKMAGVGSATLALPGWLNRATAQAAEIFIFRGDFYLFDRSPL